MCTLLGMHWIKFWFLVGICAVTFIYLLRYSAAKLKIAGLSKLAENA